MKSIWNKKFYVRWWDKLALALLVLGGLSAIYCFSEESRLDCNIENSPSFVVNSLISVVVRNYYKSSVIDIKIEGDKLPCSKIYCGASGVCPLVLGVKKWPQFAKIRLSQCSNRYGGGRYVISEIHVAGKLYSFNSSVVYQNSKHAIYLVIFAGSLLSFGLSVVGIFIRSKD